jgi:hypothetical protein
MTASTTNSKPQRKQLSEQLDRLDNILDALSEGLNGAVADAAREGTRLAIKDALVEILTDPSLRGRLHEATLPPPATASAPTEQRPGLWARLKAAAARTAQAVGKIAAKVVSGSARCARSVVATLAEAVAGVRTIGSLKKLALVGLGVGVAVGVVSYFAPHTVTAVFSGISGAVAAGAVRVSMWMRQAFRALIPT